MVDIPQLSRFLDASEAQIMVRGPPPPPFPGPFALLIRPVGILRTCVYRVWVLMRYM